MDSKTSEKLSVVALLHSWCAIWVSAVSDIVGMMKTFFPRYNEPRLECAALLNAE